MRNIFLYLVGSLYLSLFLGSCQSTEESERIDNGKPMEVKFRFDGIGELQEAGTNARSANVQGESQTITQKWEDGVVVEATLVPDRSEESMTRATTVLDPTTPIAVLAYRNGKPYKKKTITPNNASIELPMGETYDFVFYACYNDNKVSPPPLLTESSQSIDDGFYPEGETGVIGDVYIGSDMLWYKAEKVYVSASMNPLTVVFKHLFSRIRLQVADKNNLQNITQCDAYVTPVADYVPVDVTTGVWNNTLSNPQELSFTFPTQNAKSITSNYEECIPMTKADISINASFKLGNSQYTNKRFSFPGYKLQGGKGYLVQVNVKIAKSYSIQYDVNGGVLATAPASQTKTEGKDIALSTNRPIRDQYAFLGWALNANATTPNFFAGTIVNDVNLGNSLATSPSIRLYAVWQSLIAETGVAAPRIFVSGLGDSAMLLLTQSPTNYGAFFQFGRVIAWTLNNAGSADYNPSTEGSSLWSNLLYGNGAVAHTNANLRVGKGDPCRLVGMTAKDVREALVAGQTPDNGLWKLPTNEENRMMYSGATWSNKFESLGINAPKSQDGTFMPAAGCRLKSGMYASFQLGGYYWSNSSSTSNLAYYLLFRSNSVVPQSYDGQGSGFSVRCVRQ